MNAEQLALLPAAKWIPTDRQPARPPTGTSWSDFAGWVFWLDDAYELSLPPCWLQHEGVVHALSALWDSWLAVYGQLRVKGDPPPESARAAWHVQFRRPLLAEILDDRSPLQACLRRDEHVPYPRRGREAPVLADQLDAVAAGPERHGAVRDAAELDRFLELTDAHGAAAVLAVVYHQPRPKEKP